MIPGKQASRAGVFLLWAALCLPAGAVEKAAAPKPLSLIPAVNVKTADVLPTAGLSRAWALPSIPTAAQLPLIPTLAASAGPEAQKAILQALAPERSAQLSGENAKELSNLLLEPGMPASQAGFAAPVEWNSSSGPQPLPLRISAERRPGMLQTAKDLVHFNRARLRQFWWYTVTHIGDVNDRNMWPTYSRRWEELKAAGVDLPVESPRSFFSYMRVVGESGIFYVLGFSSLTEDKVIPEARRTFRKYFMSPGVTPAAAAAFDAFMRRALNYNAAKRSHANFRKHVRDAMLKASLMPASGIAAYFDGLLPEDLSRRTAEFQKERQAQVLELFKKTVLEAISEEPSAARDRVVGIILLGSFAAGSANAASDFDVELITADGGKGRVAVFAPRLQGKWRALGMGVHPVSVHESADPPSYGVVKRIHHAEYLVISPDPALVRALSRRPGERPYFTVQRHRSVLGDIGRAAQYYGVYATTLWADHFGTKPPTSQ